MRFPLSVGRMFFASAFSHLTGFKIHLPTLFGLSTVPLIFFLLQKWFTRQCHLSLLLVLKNRNLTSETMHSSENLPDSSSSNKMITRFGLWYIHRYCLVVDITITLSPKKKRGFTSTKQISARKKLTCFPA